MRRALFFVFFIDIVDLLEAFHKFWLFKLTWVLLESYQSILILAWISHKDSHVWFLVSLWFWKSIFKIIHFFYYLKIQIASVEAHLVNREVSATPVVVLRRKKDNVLGSQGPTWAVICHILCVEMVLPSELFQEESVHILVQVPFLNSINDLLWFL